MAVQVYGVGIARQARDVGVGGEHPLRTTRQLDVHVARLAIRVLNTLSLDLDVSERRF